MGLLTWGQLKREMHGYPDSTEINFGATEAGVSLVYYRVKDRGAHADGTLIVQIELNEDHGAGS